ncbi:MAG: SEC-C domain-containing protein [Magnetococcales bacterium]|nr:SEC-C domain-containing protein [Magnetococcales bacterium]
MGSPKNLNEPHIYAEALVRAVQEPDTPRLAAWLADDDNIVQAPLFKWYLYLAERLKDMAPRPELGFLARPQHTTPVPKVGRNDHCPCGSGKKYKQCHLDKEEPVTWKLGSPTPTIRNMAIATLIQSMGTEALDRVPWGKASVLARSEMASAYYQAGQLDTAVQLLKTVLDGSRDEAFMLYDYWVARYAEWLVELERPKEAEEFLLDEYDQCRGVSAWQVAQKLAAFYLDQGDPDNADTWVETSLEGEPNNPFTHYLKGLLRHGLDQWDQAIASYERALELSHQFRPQEKAYMTQMVNDSLSRARNHLPVEELPLEISASEEPDPDDVVTQIASPIVTPAASESAP